MASKLRTNLNLCFTKIKSTILEPQSNIPMSPSSSTTQQNPNHDQIHPFATTSSSSSSSTSSTLMIKNYNSLYDHDYDHHHYYSSNNSHNDNSTSSSATTSLPYLADEAAAAISVANFATAFASNRFFFSSPGRSNSIIESTSSPVSLSSSSMSSSKSNYVLINNTVAVHTYSPDPYADFRKSMQEMMDSLEEEMEEKKSSWEILHELLLCYLAVNPKSNHKFILGAFADLVVSILPTWEESGGHRQVPDFSGGGCEISRQRMEG